jgi:hypothetical protein
MKRILCVVLASLAVGCGGHIENPLGPGGADQSAPLVVLDGRTGNPIAASIVSGEISAPGFLTLRTGRDGGEVFLWPSDMAGYARALVYQHGDQPGVLARWPDYIRTIGIQPSGLMAAGRPLRELEAAVAAISQAHSALDFVIGNGDVTVSIIVDPAEAAFQGRQAGAATYQFFGPDGKLSGARIVLKEVDPNATWEEGWGYFRTVVLHELGHATGFDHLDPAGPQGIMAGNANSYSFRDFTPWERAAMGIHYNRRPGAQLNGTVEDETMVRAMGGSDHTIIIVD